jgi:uncharacterized membrane protein YfcA
VLADLRRITGDAHLTPTSPSHVLSHLFHTSYMGTAQNSSAATRSRAATLAAQLGSRHTSLNIDAVVAAVLFLAALRLLWPRPIAALGEPRAPHTGFRLLAGGAIGTLSGLTGTGGGIFLSPLILLMGWETPQKTSGVASANSR